MIRNILLLRLVVVCANSTRMSGALLARSSASRPKETQATKQCVVEFAAEMARGSHGSPTLNPRSASASRSPSRLVGPVTAVLSRPEHSALSTRFAIDQFMNPFTPMTLPHWALAGGGTYLQPWSVAKTIGIRECRKCRNRARPDAVFISRLNASR